VGRVVARIKDRSLVERRRAQIVLAARAVFRDKGFHKATVRDIGRAADVTQGTLYNYVRTKEDILFLICDELVNTYRSLIQKVAERHPEPEERLRAALAGLIEIMHEHQDDVLLMYHESHSLPRKSLRHVLARVREFIEDFALLVKDASDAMRLPAANPQLIANIVTFLPAIVALRRWDLRRCSEQKEVAEQVLEFMMRGLGRKASR
jgi:AcrR family transcriptional regulator